jgi:hypothetical protein
MHTVSLACMHAAGPLDWTESESDSQLRALLTDLFAYCLEDASNLEGVQERLQSKHNLWRAPPRVPTRNFAPATM